MQEFLDTQFWNNTIQDYLIFLGSLIVSIIVVLIFKRILLHRLAKWAEKTPTSLDDMVVKSVKRYILPLLYISVAYLNTKWLTLKPRGFKGGRSRRAGCVIALGAVVLSSLLIYLFNKYLEKKQQFAGKPAIRWISGIIKFIVWLIALLLFLDNIEDFHITTIVAGLGIGGIAIAFAAQAVLEDIFSFVTIFFDRPFEIGDFIVVDTFSGTVEHIGVKTTRVRSLSGEQLVFSNKDLTNARVHNYKRMDIRRIAFTIGVTYDTTAETLRTIPTLVKEIIESVEQTRF